MNSFEAFSLHKNPAPLGFSANNLPSLSSLGSDHTKSVTVPSYGIS